MDNAVVALLKKASDNPAYQSIVDYLTTRRAMPEVKSAYLGEGTKGEYRSNGWGPQVYPEAGQVAISSAYEPQVGAEVPAGAVATLNHELTHAQNRALGRQFQDRPYEGPFSGKAPTQFSEAYRKLVYDTNNRKAPFAEAATAQKMAPEWYNENAEYRASIEELSPFAVGNHSTTSRGTAPAPSHIDATLAQNRAILTELALREAAQRGSQGR